MRIIFIFFFLLSSLVSKSQNFKKISLDNFVVNKSSLLVAEIIDARRDKNVIGIIQRGLNNKKDFAIFNTPGLTELKLLLEQSKLISDQGLVIRVNKVWVSELTRALSETARAEFGIDVFVGSPEGYYYVTSLFATAESSRGLDVTDQHSGNLFGAIQKAFTQYSEESINGYADYSFTKSELENSSLTFRDAISAPIIQSTNYNEGFYRTFDEFLNNSPSGDINCKIKMGRSIRLRCEDVEEEIDIYGFSRDGQLYVLYHEQFFQLYKKDNRFFFKGPKTISSRAGSNYMKGWIAAGTLGGGIAVSESSYNSIYTIDLDTGAITNVTGL